MRFTKYLIISITFSLLFLSCSKKLPQTKAYITNSSNQNIDLKVEVARTQEQQEKGYMFRKNIPDGNAMIFVYDEDHIMSFWMKNTPHPLSIAFIDSSFKIRNIFDMQPYTTNKTISTCSVRYALEVPQGWFEKNNIRVGDVIHIDL